MRLNFHYRLLLLLSISTILITGCTFFESPKRPLVIISTNDIHSEIDLFPQLATAIIECRDTADLILVDAGDRWTGNIFVDQVDHYAPIYELFNHLHYDLAIYGNHEFDKGQAYLAQSNKQAQFPILGANIISDTSTFPQPPAYEIIKKDGIKIGFVGVVGNYSNNNHPAGKDENFVGIRFADPQVTASQYSYLKDSECDILILIAHMGKGYDEQFASSTLSDGYDMVIGSHSHSIVNEVINNIQVSQTGSNLYSFGATTIKMDEDNKPQITYRNIELAGYAPEPKTQRYVDGYYDNPELTSPIGQAAENFDKVALKNLFTSTLKETTKADIGLYHSGGVRLNSLPKGDISVSTVLNCEPFGAYICTMMMTPEELRELIMSKFNDKVNIKEAHYLDLNATVPYTIVTDSDSGDAVDVLFEGLVEGRRYKVATGDYIYENYMGLEYTDGYKSDIVLSSVLIDYIESAGEIHPNCTPLQMIK